MTQSGSRPPLNPRAQAVADRIDCCVLWLVSRWLPALIVFGVIVTGLPVLAPLLRALGWSHAADALYLSYRLVCHQRPERSFHLFGEPMAFCQRDLAIVGAGVLVAVIFGVLRSRRPVGPLSFTWVMLLALPMAVDGGTQLVGLRESTWELRLATGALFSAGVGWYALPRLETGFGTMREEIRARVRGEDIVRRGEAAIR